MGNATIFDTLLVGTGDFCYTVGRDITGRRERKLSPPPGRPQARRAEMRREDCGFMPDLSNIMVEAMPEGAVLISAKTRDGLEALREALLAAAGVASTTDGLFMARERHLEALRAALEHVECALRVAHEGAMMDLFAEELRLAGQALGSILGETTPDDLLGMIFSKFCIGK